MVKRNFKDHALTVVKSQIDAERSKKTGPEGDEALLAGEKYKLFVDACREFFEQRCLGMLSHNTWKS